MRPIVFDCDGVLVDSEKLAWSAWRRVLAQYDIALTTEDIALLTGRTDRDAHVHFSDRGELPDQATFWNELSEVTFRLFDQHLLAFEDATDTLDALHRRGATMAVASSSPRERLDRSLTATGLSRYFEFTVGGDEVSHGKPAPDLFLAAAAGLAVEPETCYAVEDAPAGIEAARAAGMTVVAVERGHYSFEDLRAADVVVPRLTPAPFLGS
ncbi:MAG: HAD family phosphatase [Acidimicrobiia bacterium]|nr:HAD family phosphatase [Acidimicrobiia bacterium]MDH3396594.1 HAD family phosphatase [Acidimicrobiia bacterium]MDH5615392.1 HAD family phosphatase [Acidimicrobiia bacterium]